MAPEKPVSDREADTGCDSDIGPSSPIVNSTLLRVMLVWGFVTDAGLKSVDAAGGFKLALISMRSARLESEISGTADEVSFFGFIEQLATVPVIRLAINRLR